MTRVPVPDDYERGHVSVAGVQDYHYGEADVNLETVDRARDVSVQEDDEGRYLGVSANHAEEVAAFLGTSVEGAEDDAEASESGAGDGPDGDETPEDGGMSYEERTAHAEGLASEHWRSVVTAVEDGEADDYLDELAKADDRDSAQEAIDERRAELED